MSCSEPVRLPSSFIVPIPKGAPVLVGGPPSLDLMAAAFAFLRSKWVSSQLHRLVSRIKNPRLRNFLHRAVDFLTGHPVDVGSGRVLTDHIDWELVGPVPVSFCWSYSSGWAGRWSPLGYGWSHTLDQAIWRERGKVVYRADDGREIEFDAFDLPGHPSRTLRGRRTRRSRLRRRCARQHVELRLRRTLACAGDQPQRRELLLRLRRRD